MSPLPPSTAREFESTNHGLVGGIEYMAGGTGFPPDDWNASLGRRKEKTKTFLGKKEKKNLSRRRGVLDNADLVIHGLTNSAAPRLRFRSLQTTAARESQFSHRLLRAGLFSERPWRDAFLFWGLGPGAPPFAQQRVGIEVRLRRFHRDPAMPPDPPAGANDDLHIAIERGRESQQPLNGETVQALC